MRRPDQFYPSPYQVVLEERILGKNAAIPGELKNGFPAQAPLVRCLCRYSVPDVQRRIADPARIPNAMVPNTIGAAATATTAAATLTTATAQTAFHIVSIQLVMTRAAAFFSTPGYRPVRSSPSWRCAPRNRLLCQLSHHLSPP